MRFALFMLALLPLMPAAAQPDCSNAITQADMNQCAAAELATADAALNTAYAELRQQLPKERLDALRKAEQGWIAFRTAQCEFEAGAAAGGSLQPLLRDNCLTELSRQRTRTLQDLRTGLSQP